MAICHSIAILVSVVLFTLRLPMFAIETPDHKCTRVCVVGADVRAPNVSFSTLVEKRCIYQEQTALTWDAARARCIGRGGDLFVPGDLHGLGQHVSGHSHGKGD